MEKWHFHGIHSKYACDSSFQENKLSNKFEALATGH